MIEINKLIKKYGKTLIFNNFSLEVNDNEITTILGPSGSGKTTLLNILASIDKDFSGTIKGIEESRVSYVFQESRLLKWKTVYENIEYVLNKSDNKIDEILENVDLLEASDLYPHELSGGMKQRVSIARAFVYDSDVLLMDEAFTGLDYKLRIDLINYFLKVWLKNKKTVIHITHDVEEALLISNRIIQFSDKPVKIIDDIYVDIDIKNRVDNEQIAILKEKLLKNMLRTD